MAKLESSFKNMIIVLTVITLFAGGVLASVYMLTKEPIEEAKISKQQNALKEVLPTYESLSNAEIVAVEGLGDVTLYKAYDNAGNQIGTAVESYSPNGFSGEVKVMVGFDKEGSIVNYSVLEQKETPGLGTKMVDWFKPQAEVEKSLIEKIFGIEVKTEERKSSIVGKNPAKDKLEVSKRGGDIDAITAATISSVAFLETVQSAYKAAFGDAAMIDATSGATDTAAATVEETTGDATTGATDAATGATDVTAPAN